MRAGLVIAALLVLLDSDSAEAQGCRLTPTPRSWREDCQDAPVAVVVWIESNRQSPDAKGVGAATMRVIQCAKVPPLVGFPERLNIDRFVPIDFDKPPQAYLVFAEFSNGKLDPYRGVPISKPEAVTEYLRGILAVDEADVAKRVEYAFAYVGSPDREVVSDAFVELDKLETGQLIQNSRTLDADRVGQLVKQRDINSQHLGTAVLLLAGSGKSDDVPLLLKLLEQTNGKAEAGAPDFQPAASMRMENLLIALTILAPETGFAQIRKIVDDPKQDFMPRYAALRALRHLWDYPVPKIDRSSVTIAIAAILEHEDIVDLAVGDLRRIGHWEFASKIVRLPDQFEAPIVRRAVLRYALAAPKDLKVTTDYVALMRAFDKQAVEDAEAALLLERELLPMPKQ